MHVLRTGIIPLFAVLIFSCGGTGQIQTQWDYPTGAKLRIFSQKGGKAGILAGKTRVIESQIPTVLELKTTTNANPYYIEIFTASQKRLYGKLEVLRVTQLTELSTVKVKITDEIIQGVMNNEVSKITVNDPSAGYMILRLTLGNRIPQVMRKLYNNAGRAPY